MLDWLGLRCRFSDPDQFRLEGLGIPLEASIDADGETHHLRHPWESIPSDFSSMAFKMWDFCPVRLNPEPFIEIKASPAKLSQGHNIYGSDDFGECVLVLLELFYQTYPALADRLDISTWELFEVDITYHSWAESERAARQFINALGNVSNGQTKGRGDYDGTVYFGKKDSRIKKIKVYDKYHEVLNYLSKRKGSKDDPAKFYPSALLNWAKGMIRWEARLKTRWFERRGIPTSLLELRKVFDAQAYWTIATKDIFGALAGEKMKIVKDDEVLKLLREYHPTVNSKTGKHTFGKANAAYRTYRAIKSDGYIEVKQTMGKTAFYDHIEMLSTCGLSKAMLQNMQGEGFKAEVIPLVRYAVVEFRKQYPDWYVPPNGGNTVVQLHKAA